MTNIVEVLRYVFALVRGDAEFDLRKVLMALRVVSAWVLEQLPKGEAIPVTNVEQYTDEQVADALAKLEVGQATSTEIASSASTAGGKAELFGIDRGAIMLWVLQRVFEAWLRRRGGQTDEPEQPSDDRDIP